MKTGVVVARVCFLPLLCSLLLVLASGCGDNDDQSMPAEEAVRIGNECFEGELAGSSGLPDGLNDAPKRDCIEQLAADQVGRLYLLAAASAELSTVIRQGAALLGKAVQATHDLNAAAVKVQTEPSQLKVRFEDDDRIFQDLFGFLGEGQESRQATAAEAVGVLSYLPSLTELPATNDETTLGDAISSLLEGRPLAETRKAVADAQLSLDGDDWTTRLVRSATDAIAKSFAVALWADPSVRDALIAGGASPPPAPTPDGQAIERPLVSASGVLQFPRKDQASAGAAFNAWYREGGGKPLRDLAESFPDALRIEERPHEFVALVPALFSELLKPTN